MNFIKEYLKKKLSDWLLKETRQEIIDLNNVIKRLQADTNIAMHNASLARDEFVMLTEILNVAIDVHELPNCDKSFAIICLQAGDYNRGDIVKFVSFDTIKEAIQFVDLLKCSNRVIDSSQGFKSYIKRK